MIETVNFKNPPNGRRFRASDGTLKLVERSTRTADDAIDYQFTVDEPTTWTRPWTFAIPLTRDHTQQWIYEFACHEGNYGLTHILSGARAKEKEEAAAKRK